MEDPSAAVPVGFGVGMTFNLPYSTQWTTLVHKEPPAPPEGGDEALGERIIRSIEPIREELQPEEFVDRAVGFLGAIGVVHVARVEADGTGLYAIQEGSTRTLEEIRTEVVESLQLRGKPPRRLEWKAFGRSQDFFLDFTLVYRPLHTPRDPGLQLTVKSKPSDLDPLSGESAGDYQQRLERLSTDPGRFKKFSGASGQKQMDIESDLSYHLRSAFPGLEFSVADTDGQIHSFGSS